MVPSRTLAGLVFFLVAVASSLAWPSAAQAGEKLKVLVPDKDNLQFLAFWAAKAGGSFEREQLDVEVTIAPPPRPREGTPPIEGLLERGEVDAAVATPAVYLRMIAAKAPVVVVANLFANDPYALVVRREVAEERKLSPDASLHDRVTGLKGMPIGYPPASFARLRGLLASQQIDSEKDVTATALVARDQSTPFKKPGLDAAFLASPHLEKAVVGSGAWVLVNLARGEVPELASKQTHVLVVSRRMIEQRRAVVTAAVRAIGDAERRIHSARSEVVDALARELSTRDRAELETIVALYEPAIPQSPAVRVQDLGPALALVPESIPKPDLTGIDLAAFVATDLSSDAAKTAAPTASGTSVPWVAIGVGVFVIGAIVLVIRRRRAA